jgi:hypothetical protein
MERPELFGELRKAILAIPNQDMQGRILVAVSELEYAAEGADFQASYKKFVEVAGDYIFYFAP